MLLGTPVDKPVNADPSIAGKAPVSLLEVKVDILASATVPDEMFDPFKDVKPEPLPDTLLTEILEGSLALASVPELKLLAFKLFKSVEAALVFI